MSLLVFPTYATLGINFPVKQTPIFNTIIQSPASGRGELRIPTMLFPRWDFVLSTEYIKGNNQGANTAWQTLVNFYMAAQGAAEDWLFLHPEDNIVGSYTVTGSVTSGRFVFAETLTQTATGATAQYISNTSSILTIGPVTGSADNTHTWVGQATSHAVFTPSALPVLATSQQVATGDGVTTVFGIYRQIVSGGAQDLIQNFVGAFPKIYVNGVLKTVTTDYTIDQYGDITFVVAPANAATIAWTGQFYYRCHFLDDTWADLQEDYYQIWSHTGIKFRSVLL
jgi:hypothetical protein